MVAKSICENPRRVLAKYNEFSNSSMNCEMVIKQTIMFSYSDHDLTRSCALSSRSLFRQPIKQTRNSMMVVIWNGMV